MNWFPLLVRRLPWAAPAAVAAVLTVSCSIGRPVHSVSLWEWYRTTDRAAEIQHLAWLRQRTRGDDPPAGLRLERAFHERRVGETARVPGLLAEERRQHPIAAPLIDRLAADWDVVLPEADEGMPLSVQAANERSVLLCLPTLDRIAPAARTPARPPLAAFDAAVWEAARGEGRYVVPMQVALRILEIEGWRLRSDTVESLPWDALVEEWGVRRVYAPRVTLWQAGRGVIRYAVQAGLYGPGSGGGSDALSSAEMSSVVQGEEEVVLAGPMLEDNPMGAENERVGTRRVAVPLDEREVAMGLQRGLVGRVLRGEDG